MRSRFVTAMAKVGARLSDAGRENRLAAHTSTENVFRENIIREHVPLWNACVRG
jgi:hypothetical protein